MPLDKNALQHIEDNAVTQSINNYTDHNGFPIIALPSSVTLESIEHLMPAPQHFKGCFQTQIVNEFTAYCNHENDMKDPSIPVVFIDDENMSAKATFDFGVPQYPQHRFHTANLTLKKSKDLSNILNLDGKQLSQKALAELIEEHHANIATLAKESTIGAGAPSIELNQAINAIRNINIKAKAESGSKIEDFSESQSAFASIDVDNTEGKIPAYIDFKCVPYKGLKLPYAMNSLLPGEEIEKEELKNNEHRVFRLHVSVLTGGDKPMFSLKLLRLAEHEEAMATAFKDQLIENLCNDAIVRIGTFK